MRIKKVAGCNQYLVLNDEGYQQGIINGPDYLEATHGFPEAWIDASFEARVDRSMTMEELDFVRQQVSGMGKYCFDYEFRDGLLYSIDGLPADGYGEN